MQNLFFFIIGSTVILSGCINQQTKNDKATRTAKEKTVFQTASIWKPTIDVRSDVAIIYGTRDVAGMSFEERVQTWREKDYTTHFMTGIAWGAYPDYFTGKWDGETHFDEGQMNQRGDTIWHGHMVPYIVPSMNFIKYMNEAIIRRVIDAGIDAIYLEEPEFWARAGYSESFKKEWKDYYGFDWRAQHESPENTYLSNKLKYHLYYRALDECSTYAKEYGKSKGMNIRCYVPTHSLVNYSQWRIVSPEASLASLPNIDGYIAQVWTGTSREPNYFNGKAKERVFETAYLEYGSMESMTAPTGRKMFFLTDPIEDWPRDWVDYKKNYQATFTAQLLYPMIADYEVMPWPNRIYHGLYKTSRNSDKKEQIPSFYSTQIQVMINTLNNMPLSENKVSGTNGIGILMANSLMFQRFPYHDGYDDPKMSNFFGLTLPLLKRGIPVQTVHIENASYSETWENIDILIMSYSGMKPMDPAAHLHIAKWVKNGGVLVYCGRDEDTFQSVQEWWNTNENNFNAPSEHLFSKLGLEKTIRDGLYDFGKGKVCVIRKDPKEFVLEENADDEFVDSIKKLYKQETNNGELEFKNYFSLSRGPYEIISVLDENEDETPYLIKGKLIDLFDPEIPVLDEKQVYPGEQAFLCNIGSVSNPETPQVLACAGRIYDEDIENTHYSCTVKSPLNTSNVMRVLLPEEAQSVSIRDAIGNPVEIIKESWDKSSRTYFLNFDNHPDGVSVKFSW